MEALDPPVPDFTEAFVLYKFAKYRPNVLIKRYFVIENDNLLQYTDQNATAPCKTTSLSKAECKVDIKDELLLSSEALIKDKNQWSQTGQNYRLQIILMNNKKKGQRRVVYFYSDDYNLIIALKTRISFASGNIVSLQNIGIITIQLNLVHSVTLFEKFWNQILQIYVRCDQKMKALDQMKPKLCGVANTVFQNNRQISLVISKFIQSQIINQKAQQYLIAKKRMEELGGLDKVKSAFKFGKAKPNKKQNMIEMIPSFLKYRAEQLVNFVRTSRSRRDQITQLELDYLCKAYQSGYEADRIDFQAFTQQNQPLPQMTIKGKGHIYLKRDYILLEDLNNSKVKALARSNLSFNQILNLSEISLMSTDLIIDYNRGQEMDKQTEYTINIFGPFQNQTLRCVNLQNVLSELCYYAPLKHKRNLWFKLIVDSIKLPLDFVVKYNNKCFIKLKITFCRSQNQNPQKQFYVYSEDISLSLTENQIKDQQASQQNPDKNIEILTNQLNFNIDKLVDSQSERFYLSILYVPIKSPVQSVLKEYIIKNESLVWDQLNSNQIPDFQETNDSILILESQVQKGKAIVKFSLNPISNENTEEQLDFKEGPRLLIGKYCILDPNNQAQICQVLECNRDGTLKLRLLSNHEIIDRKIHIRDVKLIERYGVSVYNSNNEPEELKTAKFSWVCSIKTKNKRLLNMIQVAIQNWQVRASHKRRLLYQEKQIASGNIVCSLLKLQGLQNCSALKTELSQKINIQPFVKILIGNAKDITVNKKPIVSDVILQNEETPQSTNKIKDLGVLASWINKKNPLGQLINLGLFNKSLDQGQDLQQNILIQFEVYNQEESNERLLGVCSVQVNDIIDLINQANELTLMLELNNVKCGVITFQTRFLPDAQTRFRFNLYNNTTKLKTPESYLHFKSLLETKIIDKFNYEVPLGDYNWFEHTELEYMNRITNSLRPLQLKGIQEFKQNVNSIQTQFKSRQIGQKQASKLQMQFDKQVFISQEEMRDILIWCTNQQRPQRQAFTNQHINLWWARKILSERESQKQLSRQYWKEFLDDLPQQNDMNFILDELKEESVDFYSTAIQVLYDKKDQIIQQKSISHKIHNSDISQLIFLGYWEEQKTTLFNDVFVLTHQIGIPSEIRSKIWREFLKAQISELDEILHFKRTIKDYDYNQDLTVYVNYKVYADLHDCLAFQQIDEDVGQYVFPKGYLSNLSESQLNRQILNERAQIRSILRVLCFWSLKKNQENLQISISYGYGTLDIIQRILTVANLNKHSKNVEEDVFWILIGLIKFFPKLFSVSSSVLQGDCFSVMRSEMITFKSLVQNNLPKVFQKLKDFGLPIEMLVYAPILSMYSQFFSSELVLRLWDIIFYSFSFKDKLNRKQGLWYILAPAYLVLKKKESQITNALNCEDICKIFKGGCTLWYDSSAFIEELEQVCQDLFVEESQVVKQNQFFTLIFGQKITHKNEKAYLFEEQRFQYYKKIQQIFKPVIAENQIIYKLISSQRQMDAQLIQQSIIYQFEQISLGQGSLSKNFPIDAGQKINFYTNSLPLKKVNMFIHNLCSKMLQQHTSYNVKIQYGLISENSQIFQPLQEVQQMEKQGSELIFAKKTLQSHIIESYSSFDYVNGANFIKVELFDGENQNDLICDTIISLQEIDYDRFSSQKYILRNLLFLQNPSHYTQHLDQIQISFFLEIKSNQTQTTDLYRILSTFNRKLPGIIDIFNISNFTDLTKDFKQIVQKDYQMFMKFLNKQQCLEIINESYNYYNIDQYGHISESEFTKIALKLFPQNLGDVQMLRNIYKVFTEPRTTQKSSNDQNQISANNFLNKLYSQRQVNVPEVEPQPFSLRSFLTSVILMSQSTVKQKASMLYDLFDLADGSSDCLRSQSAYQLIYTVFQRSLEYIPHHELMSIVEFVFNGQVSMVYRAYWTRDISKIQENLISHEIDLQSFIQQQSKVNLQIEGTSINVTEQIQHSLLNYFSVFGSRVIDFNQDGSAFNNLQDLIGIDAKVLLQQTRQYKYKLVLFCQTGGERFNFDIIFDQENGNLVQAGQEEQLNNQESQQTVNSITGYFQRNTSRLFLNGLTRPISKTEFLTKIEQIPMFANLIRTETFYQDKVINDLKPVTQLKQKLIVSFVMNTIQFQFQFADEPKTKSEEQSVEGKDFTFTQDPSLSFTLRLHRLNEQNLLSDVRQRIINAFNVMIDSEQYLAKLISKSQIDQDLAGGKSWYLLYKNEWKSVKDSQRLSELDITNSNLILLKLSTVVRASIDEELNYDCQSYYKHGDKSFEWRPCRIVRRTPIQDDSSQIDQQLPASYYYYWIEFEHAKKQGNNMWVKRNASEILFSTEYTRLYMPDFISDSVKYVNSIYADTK